MSLKLLPSFIVSLCLGFGLGCIPVLNEHLHWNLWFIIPVSGLIFGALVGWLQFWVSYPINQNIGGIYILLLAIGAMIGYAAIDYGIYFVSILPAEGIEGIPDGNYRLSEIVPFSEYMKWRLGSSSISTRHGKDFIEMGSAGTTISYVIDLIGSLAGSAGALLYFSEKYPYCKNCNKYKKRERKYEIIFDYDEEKTEDIFSKITDLIEKANYMDIVAYFHELSENSQQKGDVKIVVDQRFCPFCREATLIGNIFRKTKREWEEVDELKFSFTSKPGEHLSLIV